jgi:hypothetical protein
VNYVGFDSIVALVQLHQKLQNGFNVVSGWNWLVFASYRALYCDV